MASNSRAMSRKQKNDEGGLLKWRTVAVYKFRGRWTARLKMAVGMNIKIQVERRAMLRPFFHGEQGHVRSRERFRPVRSV